MRVGEVGVPGHRMDSGDEGLFGDSGLFGVGLPPGSEGGFMRMPSEIFGLPSGGVPGAHMAKYGPEELFGLGQLIPNIDTVEKVAEAAAVGGAAGWLLLPSSKTKDISSKVLGAGLAAVALFKIGRLTGILK